MPWARFTANYDHRWPSRAMTAYRADGGADGNGLYQVKREVLEAARAAGKATEARKPAKPGTDGALGEAADDMAVRDPAADRDDASGNELEPDGGDGRSAELSNAVGAG